MNHSVSENLPVRGVARAARWSVTHRWIVVAGWIILAIVGGLAAARSGSRLSFTFDLPGQPAYEANTAIVKTFGSGGDNPPLVAVIRLPPGTTVSSPGVKGEIKAVFGKASAALPGVRTASWISTGDRAFVSADGRTTFELLYPVANFASSDPYGTALPRLTRAIAGQHVHGAPVRVTGATILSSGGQGGGNSVLAETLLAGLGALVILAIVFGSFIAITPLIIAAVAIPTAFAFIYALTYVTTMSTLVQNIVALVGLGVAIDYALLIVTRWREERGRGLANRAAVLRASATAGRSVLFSGLTVTVSLAALALTTVPFLRSIGLAGLAHPAGQHRRIGDAPARHPRYARPPAGMAAPQARAHGQPAVDPRRRGCRRPSWLVGRRSAGYPGRADRPRLLAQPRRAAGHRHRSHRPGRRPRGPGRPDLIRHRPRCTAAHRDSAARAQPRTAARAARSLWSRPPPGPATASKSPTPGHQPTHRPATARPRCGEIRTPQPSARRPRRRLPRPGRRLHHRALRPEPDRHHQPPS